MAIKYGQSRETGNIYVVESIINHNSPSLMHTRQEKRCKPIIWNSLPAHFDSYEHTDVSEKACIAIFESFRIRANMCMNSGRYA